MCSRQPEQKDDLFLTNEWQLYRENYNIDSRFRLHLSRCRKRSHIFWSTILQLWCYWKSPPESPIGGRFFWILVSPNTGWMAVINLSEPTQTDKGQTKSFPWLDLSCLRVPMVVVSKYFGPRVLHPKCFSFDRSWNSCNWGWIILFRWGMKIGASADKHSVLLDSRGFFIGTSSRANTKGCCRCVVVVVVVFSFGSCRKVIQLPRKFASDPPSLRENSIRHSCKLFRGLWDL